MTELKRYLHWAYDWENNIACKEGFKESEALTGKCDSFHSK